MTTDNLDDLIALLKEETFWLHHEAEKKLIAAGPDAIPALIEALENESWRVRHGCAMALGKVGNANAVEALMRIAINDEQWRVQEAAIKTLGLLGDSRAMQTLVELLQDSHDSIRAQAAESLVSFGAAAVPPLRAALHDSDDDVRLEAALALAYLGQHDGVALLRAVLQNPHSPMEIRSEAQEALAKLGVSG